MLRQTLFGTSEEGVAAPTDRMASFLNSSGPNAGVGDAGEGVGSDTDEEVGGLR